MMNDYDYDDIPDTPEQRQLIADHNAEIRRKYPNLRCIDNPIPGFVGIKEKFDPYTFASRLEEVAKNASLDMSFDVCEKRPSYAANTILYMSTVMRNSAESIREYFDEQEKQKIMDVAHVYSLCARLLDSGTPPEVVAAMCRQNGNVLKNSAPVANPPKNTAE